MSSFTVHEPSKITAAILQAKPCSSHLNKSVENNKALKATTFTNIFIKVTFVFHIFTITNLCDLYSALNFTVTMTKPILYF